MCLIHTQFSIAMSSWWIDHLIMISVSDLLISLSLITLFALTSTLSDIYSLLLSSIFFHPFTFNLTVTCLNEFWTTYSWVIFYKLPIPFLFDVCRLFMFNIVIDYVKMLPFSFLFCFCFLLLAFM